MFDWLKRMLGTTPPAPAATPRVASGPGTEPPAQTTVGCWIRMTLPGVENMPGWPAGAAFVGFTYLDPQAGVSAKGGPEGTPTVADQPIITVRDPRGVALTAQEVAALKLPAVPTWLQHFGPQPDANAAWRSDPHLQGRFAPGFPDDVQVMVHDGEPRRVKRQVELCWVRLVAQEPSPRRLLIQNKDATPLSPQQFDAAAQGRALYRGRLLNTPTQLHDVKAGDELLLLSGAGVGHPVMVTPEYLQQRPLWGIQPCSTCGFSEALDPPLVLVKTRFPDLKPDEAMEHFTSFCPLGCGGMQLFSLERTQ